jgi:hypothetical protein
MRRAIGPAALVPLLACLVWAGTASALSIDGTATVDYSGHRTQTFVYQPTDPPVWQGTLDMTWDEKETFSLSGRAQKNPTVKVLSRSLTISGSVTNTFAAPNEGLTCSASLSARPGSPDPMSPGYGGQPLGFGVDASVPNSGYFIQSSAPDDSHCASPAATGGPGFVSPEQAIKAEASASPAEGSIKLPGGSYSKAYNASGSDAQTTETFHAVLVVTAGCTRGKNADAIASSATACGSCPNPADDPLPGEAEHRALEIWSDHFEGDGLGKDGLAESALHNIKSLGKRLRREFPLKTDDDRAERKRQINAGADIADNQIDRAYEKAKRDLADAEARDLARAKCPGTKEKIREIYKKQSESMETERADDLKFVANEVVGTVNLFCGCHLSADVRTGAADIFVLPLPRERREASAAPWTSLVVGGHNPQVTGSDPAPATAG